jgi:pyruvate dehydrogenase E2 component (dihydrolipoyllysine-residue acetyltransferase)
MTDFTMPSLGADMDEGTLLEWMVSPGDVVHKGDIVAVIDTSKAAVDVETFTDGVVEELVVPVGSTVPVGTVLAHLSATGDDTAAPPRRAESTPPANAPHAHHQVDSPLVRRLAADLGVDLESVEGTGPGGRVTRGDVAQAASVTVTADQSAVPALPSPRPPGEHARVTPYARRLARELGVELLSVNPADGETVRAADIRAASEHPTEPAATPREVAAPESPAAQTPRPAAARAAQMRETTGRLMARSKREIPHYYLQTTVDLTRALTWMRARNEALSVTERLVPAALLLWATARATTQHAQLNGFWTEDGFEPGSGVHLGVAVSLRGGGLVAPAIHDADRLSVEETMSRMRDLVTRARAGRLRGSELADPTLTVTNLGDQGVEAVHGVIYPPQVALVGFGRVVERPVAVDGLLGVHPVTTLTLAADHRATDGFTGGRFLAAIDDLLQHLEEP